MKIYFFREFTLELKIHYMYLGLLFADLVDLSPPLQELENVIEG